MDASVAARMSDPERSPHFRRRWQEPARGHSAMVPGVSRGDLGPIGVALLEAWRRKQQETAEPPVAARR